MSGEGFGTVGQDANRVVSGSRCRRLRDEPRAGSGLLGSLRAAIETRNHYHATVAVAAAVRRLIDQARKAVAAARAGPVEYPERYTLFLDMADLAVYFLLVEDLFDGGQSDDAVRAAREGLELATRLLAA